MTLLSEYRTCEQGYRGPRTAEQKMQAEREPTTDEDVEPVRFEDNNDVASLFR